jgi:uncharacterized protein YfaS (alpha-2-macroglobulin family)
MADATDSDWITSMFDMQADLAKRAVNEANVQRRRVRELEKQIAEGAAGDLYEMRERITQLEQLLAEARNGSSPGEPK